MNLLALAPGNNAQLLAWIFLAFTVVFIYRVVRWFFSGPVSAEPWSSEVTAEMEREDARPLCYHCLEPHDPDADFCPDCGGPVGRYTNWLPFPYLFSIGHLLRTGTSGEFKKTPLTLIGFVLFSLVEYSVFAPIYWIQLALGLNRPQQQSAGSSSSPPPPLPDPPKI